MRIGDWLQRERERREHTIQSVAKFCAVRMSRISEIEANAGLPTDRELANFALLYDVKLKELEKARKTGRI